eukprot:gene12075-biopygen888
MLDSIDFWPARAPRRPQASPTACNTLLLPPAAPELQLFDALVRRAFERITGALPTDGEWREAALGVAQGGLGLRSCADHAAAAYVASRSAAGPLSARIDAAYAWEAAACPDGPLARALAAVAAAVPDSVVLDVRGDGPRVRQRTLSMAIDAAALQGMLAAAPPDARARLRAKQTEHAGAWLTAVPAPALGLWLEPALFTTAVRLWLGIPVSDEENQVCPACGAAVADLGAHALACMSSGSATLRHHALRDLLWFKCRTAGLRPEVEKEGLLPHTLY